MYGRQFAIASLSAASICFWMHAAAQEQAADLPDRSVFMTRRMPYREFDRLPQTSIEVGASKVRVAFAPGDLDLSHEAVIAWVKRCAAIVAKYYGGFPVDDARVLVIPMDGSGVQNGTTWGYRGAATKLFVGKSATLAQLDDDWVLVHEMVHYAFPDLDNAHNWMSEGQATYIENVARTQAGARDVRAAWKEIVTNMPKGLPGFGDEGLDHTHTWGRTYWGGALFCLLADIEIHKRTQNRFGLRDALRAVVGKSGVTTEHWPLENALKIGDDAVGVKVLEELYDKFKAAPGKIDLEQLWRDLGVSIVGGEVSFNDKAPLAKVREAIMKP